MIYPKTDRIGPSFTQPPPYRPQFNSTKVVIVDKRNSQTQPQIYALSPESMIDAEDLQKLKAQFLSGFYEGVFIPMGILQSIDRQKKLVKLPQEKLISYKYLIVVTNHKNNFHRDNVNELYCGLNALIDALRIEKSRAISKNLESYQSRKFPPALERKQVQHLQNKCPITTPEIPLRSTDSFFAEDMLLYEVQT
jgi:NADH dehydrogenase FAD-containing subunit